MVGAAIARFRTIGVHTMLKLEVPVAGKILNSLGREEPGILIGVPEGILESS